MLFLNHETKLRTLLRNKLMLLWGGVLVLLLLAMLGRGWLEERYLTEEFAEAMRQAQVTNDALVGHTQQVIGQVDTLLLAVRSYYQHSDAVEIEELERFVAALRLKNSFIENIYVINAAGQVLLPSRDRAQGHNALERDYFRFHRENAEDVIRIGPVDKGQLTGKYQFRVTRRLSDAEGRFLGVVLIPVEPKAFTSYYRQLLDQPGNTATLSGTLDRKLRARSPEPASDAWDRPLSSELWQALAQASSGTFRTVSALDQVERQFVYRVVDDYPLVMSCGFSNDDVRLKAAQRMLPVNIAGAAAVIIIVMLALLLTFMSLQHDEMRRMAQTDALTGIFNRRHLMEVGFNEVARAERYKNPLSLMMLDVDHFKVINDNWGHPTGDRVLLALASAMTAIVRKQDIVGRFGGEEFLVILPETDKAGALVIAERLRAYIEQHAMAKSEDGSVVRFKVSIGVITRSDEESTFPSLLSRVDKAMYAAKQAGRNCVVAG